MFLSLGEKEKYRDTRIEHLQGLRPSAARRLTAVEQQLAAAGVSLVYHVLERLQYTGIGTLASQLRLSDTEIKALIDACDPDIRKRRSQQIRRKHGYSR